MSPLFDDQDEMLAIIQRSTFARRDEWAARHLRDMSAWRSRAGLGPISAQARSDRIRGAIRCAVGSLNPSSKSTLVWVRGRFEQKGLAHYGLNREGDGMPSDWLIADVLREIEAQQMTSATVPQTHAQPISSVYCSVLSTT